MSAGALLSVVLGLASWWLWPRNKPDTAPLTPLPLTAASGFEGQGSFSPDGNQIAYSWTEIGSQKPSHIYVKLIGSGRPAQLTAGPETDDHPAWSPDGRRIAFFRGAGQNRTLYLIPSAGGTERRLADGFFYGPGSWSPDGGFLAIS